MKDKLLEIAEKYTIEQMIIGYIVLFRLHE